MQLALVDGERATAAPKANAVCQFCGSAMVAKCGPVVTWHWAHTARPRCDTWWENETDWHRGWKARFPTEQQEIVHFASDGEKHIADVKTAFGLVVELQNSPISLQELQSREAFYKTMIWIVNGEKFLSGFHILMPLPPPDSPLAQDIYVVRSPRFPLDPSAPGYRITNQPLFVRKRHVRPMGDGVTFIDMGGVYSKDSPHQGSFHPHDVMEELAKLETPFWYLDWRRPASSWLSARAPVFFDLPGPLVWRLHRFQDEHLCVEEIDKAYFARRLVEGAFA
jgi:competence protein CoiA